MITPVRVMVVSVISLVPFLFGQNTLARTEFEVASVKPSLPLQGPVAIGMLWAQDRSYYSMSAQSLPVKGRTLVLHNRTLLQLTMSAYRMRMIEVAGPGWTSELRFDIDAKLPADAVPASANQMLQVLLEERFALETHREIRNLAGFALVVGKGGPHLAPSAPSPIAIGSDGRPNSDQVMREIESWAKQHRGSGDMEKWVSNSATIADIAESLGKMLHVPVVDKTSLTGTYNVSMEVPRPESPDDPWELRVKRVVEKLGLRLEPRKVPTTVLVIDSALRMPTAN
jgi:uncharacterized protein (TIGR03435 family)